MAAPTVSGVTLLRSLLENDTEGCITETNTTSDTNAVDSIALGAGGLDAYTFRADQGVQTLASPGILAITLPSPPYDFSDGRLLGIGVAPVADAFRFGTLANRGLVLRVYSDSGKTEYREWIIFGGEYATGFTSSARDNHVYFTIQLTDSAQDANTTAGFDPETIWAVDIIFSYSATGGSAREHMLSALYMIQPTTILGGDSSTPANKTETYNYLISRFYGNDPQHLAVNLSDLKVFRQTVRELVGDGSTSTYYQLDFISVIFERTYTVAGDGWLLRVFDDETNGIVITQSATCHTRLNGCFFTGTQHWAFVLDGHLSATVRELVGGVFLGYGNAIFDNFNISGATFAEGKTISLEGSTSFIGNIVRDSVGTFALGVQSTNSISGCTIRDNPAGILIDSDGDYELSAITFTGNTYDFVVTATGDVEIAIDSACSTDHSGGFTDSGYAAAKINNTGGATITFVSPTVTFTAGNINNGGFDNVRCRLSYYKRATFATTDVNTTDNTITITGISGRVTTQTRVRLSGTDLPAPLLAENSYFIHAVSTDTFSLSATAGGGGTQIDLTDVGSGDMIAILTTELDIDLVTSGGYSVDLSAAQTAKGVTLQTNDQLLFQAIDWKGSLQTHTPVRASQYHEELQLYAGGNISTLTELQPYTEHDTFAISQSTDGYEISQLTVTDSDPVRYQWRVDSSAPGKVQIESEDPDRDISTQLAVLFFQFVQWTESGIRLFRGQIVAENLNSIRIQSPEVGVSPALTVESFPNDVPLIVSGPGMYRTDGTSWIATGSSIQHQPTALLAVPIRVEVATNLAEPVMNLIHAMAAGIGYLTSSNGSLTTEQNTNLANLAATLASAGVFSEAALANAPIPLDATETQTAVEDALSSYTVPTLAQIQAAGFTTDRNNALIRMAKQLGLVAGVTATHTETGITVSDGDGSTTITDNGGGSYTVESA